MNDNDRAVSEARSILKHLVRGPGGENGIAYANALALAHTWLRDHREIPGWPAPMPPVSADAAGAQA